MEPEPAKEADAEAVEFVEEEEGGASGSDCKTEQHTSGVNSESGRIEVAALKSGIQ